jgi:glycosyltransferase involved in cell wall biosynthesis
MWQVKKVSVIFPAYNEEENIKVAVEDFFSTGVVDEIIVIDNNSKDRTSLGVLW